MNSGYGKLNDDGTLVSSNKLQAGFESLDVFEKDGNGDYCEVYLLEKVDGVYVADTPALTELQLIEDTRAWKATRQVIIDAIEVTYNGIVYQGDETSQNRITKVVSAFLPDDVTTISWVAKDNSIQDLNRIDLKAILLDAIEKQRVVWYEGRPS